jgi:tetratricopeptide (TPR) repeat protein
MHFRIPRAIGLGLLGLAVLAGCKQPGLINKTKYEDKKYVNTCDQFDAEVNALVDANGGATVLRLAQYDNTQFDYFFLEPGQFAIAGDTLYFRLINDIEYGKYLHKGVAVHVNTYYASQPHLAEIESDPSGVFPPMIIDQAYYAANKEPFFVYKVFVGKKITGKQISIDFSVVKYDKKGALKQDYCNSLSVPFGTLEPACCTSEPWEATSTQSIVQVPDLEIADESYRYKGFRGTLDLIFPMESVKYDEKKLLDAVENYIANYKKLGYDVTSINIDGYASQGGTVEYNQNLSERRVAAVREGLMANLPSAAKVSITAAGRGEDWDRFRLLVEGAPSFSPEQRQALLDITDSPASPDEKEAKLRKLPYWKTLIDEVLQHCRHTFITFQFKYTPDNMYVEEFASELPIHAPELSDVANKKMTIGRYKPGGDAKTGLKVLNVLIDDNANKKANLFAMRSTYHFGLNNVQKAILDIEAALDDDKNNVQYAMAMLAYKTKFADNYTLGQRVQLLNDYNTYVAKFPGNRTLFFNRAVMMEKVGYLSGALAEYDALMGDGNNVAVGANNRGVAALKSNRLVEAQAHFLDAIQLDSKLAEPHYNLAILFAYKGLTSKSIEHLDTAIKLDPALKAQVCGNPAFEIIRQNPKFDKFGC